MTDYTAQMKSKGLDATGVTEEIARDLYNRLGSHMMFIVEGRVDARTEGTDGSHKVQLTLTMVEPATDDTLDDHLRELARTLHFNRAIDTDQPMLDGGDGINPKVGDVIAAGHRHRPHPFLPVDAADDNGICDVCGLIDAAGVHSTQDFLPDVDDDEDSSEEPYVDTEGDFDDYDADPEHQGPHAYDAGPDDACQCGRPFEADIHVVGQAGPEPTVVEVLAAKQRAEERQLNAVPDPFTPTAS